VSRAKTAESIEMPFGMWTRLGPRMCAPHLGPRWGAHGRHLAKTTEPSMCDGDTAFLSDYLDHLLSNLSY